VRDFRRDQFAKAGADMVERSASSLVLPCPAPSVATSRIQRRTSRSPKIDNACRTKRISLAKPNAAEFK
jgi:hypothetical protein